MKKTILFLLAIAAIVASCKTDEPIVPFKIDPNATILLKPDAKGWTKAPQFIHKAKVAGLTPIEIVEQAVNVKWQSNYAGNVYYETPRFIARGFAPAQRDLTIPALKMWGIDILYQEQTDSPIAIYKDFLYGYSVYITDNNNDTIAYVPEDVIQAAKIDIETAFEAEDYDEIYRLFNEAFTFLPIK